MEETAKLPGTDGISTLNAETAAWKPDVVIGVDPGLSGVFAARKLGSDVPVRTYPAPFTMHKDRYARPVVDEDQWESFCEDVCELCGHDDPRIYVMIESPAIHGSHDSGVAIAGIHWYAGAIDTAFRLEGWESAIEYARPQQWQAAIIHPYIGRKGYPFPKGVNVRARWKQLSIEYVRENYGSDCLKFSKRVRKENDNIADAICISEYASRVVSGEIEFDRSWVYTPRKKWLNRWNTGGRSATPAGASA